MAPELLEALKSPIPISGLGMKVFAAPFKVLQPPGCPPTGGGRLADLAAEIVLEAMGYLPWHG